MKTPEEYNKDYMKKWWELQNSPKKAGVVCECGEEMVFSDNMVLTSNPPQAHIHCPKCGVKTTIYV